MLRVYVRLLSNTPKKEHSSTSTSSTALEHEHEVHASTITRWAGNQREPSAEF